MKHRVFVKKLDFFQNTSSSRPFFKVVCYFIYREKQRPVIHFFNCSGFSKRTRAAWAILSSRLIFLPKCISFCQWNDGNHPFFDCTVPFSVSFSLYHCSHLLSLIALHCHSLSLVVTRCTTRCHSLSLVVIRCHSLFHLLSLACLFINDQFKMYMKRYYKRWSSV